MKGGYMKKDLTAAELIIDYINAIDKLIEKEGRISQLQLITNYSSNLNSLLNKSKAKIHSQILNTKNAVDICDEPVDFNQQSTFGKNKFSSFNSLKKSGMKKTKKKNMNHQSQYQILSPTG